MRVAVVTASGEDGKSEEALVARRIAGSLAHEAEVEVLVAAGSVKSRESRAAFSVQTFPAGYPENRSMLLSTIMGRRPNESFTYDPAIPLAEWPGVLQREFVQSRGGDSAELAEFLRNEKFEAVVFIGYSRASTFFGMQSLGFDTDVVLVPCLVDEPWTDLTIYDFVFDRPDRILVMTDRESGMVRRRVAPSAWDKVNNVRFPVQVNHSAAATEPVGFEPHPTLVFVGEPDHGYPVERLAAYAAGLHKEMPEVKVAALGSSWARYEAPEFVETPRWVSRADLWRWAARALAVVDLRRDLLIGIDALESLLLGTPVIVDEKGGASREHAESGNGGLWFVTYDEFRLCADSLGDERLREALATQGREYATLYGDPETFTKAVLEAVLR